MDNYASAKNALATDRPMSRIDNDVETVKCLVDRVESITQRIMRNARALGYEPTPEVKVSAPAAVITTLADAIRALDSAVDHCSGSLNAFD